jgi:hypothetical protein
MRAKIVGSHFKVLDCQHHTKHHSPAKISAITDLCLMVSARQPKNPFDHILRGADRRNVARLNARNVDLGTALSLNHLNLGFLGVVNDGKIVFADQVRDGKMFIASIGQRASKTSGRVLDEQFAPFQTLLIGHI